MHSDCLIRATTTDGDSLSVKEALYYKKKVIASNCVDRVPNVILYDNLDFNQLQEKILSIETDYKTTPFEMSNAAELLVKLYSKLLS